MERCKKGGIRVRRTAKEISVKKMKDRLLGKSSWFRKPKGAKQDNQSARGQNRRGKKD